MQTLLTSKPKVTYAAFQPEIGKNGTKHIQGCVSFQDAKTWEQVKAKFPGAYVAALISSLQKATEYCTKDDTRNTAESFGPTVLGALPAQVQGLRTDLQRLADFIKTGATEKSIFEEFPEEYLRYDRGIGKAGKFYWRPRTEKTVVHWHYGPTGTGKSLWARDTFPDAYWKDTEDHKWWDGFVSGQTVILDEFRSSWCPYKYLLRLFDRYPMTGQTKGSTVQLNMPYIIVTTPYHPNLTYRNRTAADRQQLLRRIEHIVYHPSIDYPTEVHWNNQCQQTFTANLINRTDA